jgi:hypothetical protein
MGESECFQYGSSGGCDYDCPVFLRGECRNADEMLEGASEEELELYHEIYGE